MGLGVGVRARVDEVEVWGARRSDLKFRCGGWEVGIFCHFLDGSRESSQLYIRCFGDFSAEECGRSETSI